jgi:hypothetical protein
VGVACAGDRGGSLLPPPPTPMRDGDATPTRR